MAESVVRFALEKLGDAFVKEELHLNGIGEQVERVSRELIRIQAFLKDADRKLIVDESQKQWVKEVRDVAYDIEDVIDTILSESERTEEKSGIMEAGKRWLTGIKKIPTVHRLANEINKIQERIKEIEASRDRFGITNLGEGTEGEMRLPVRPIMLPDVDEDGIVGFEAGRDKIISLLLDEKIKRLSVISIVGPGGLGKTTLARKVYNSEAVKQQFPIRIWVVFSQKFNSIDILGKIAAQLQIEPPRDLNDYDRLTKLQESSLELFFKKALPDSNTNKGYPDDLYDIGEKFAKSCGGLPLALKVLGGLLSTKPANSVSWRTEMEKLDWGNDGEECSAIIGTSYDDLPFALKSCFMYFAAFPEDYEIDMTSLLRMWVAEGFIPQQENKTLEDTAEMFMEDLVQRYFIKTYIIH
ncbi:hypothetical protein LUZ61_012112 [Rhynchospora tenuis]|uniref:NB-ARC domain-containing protein n=1 Tax=Rhynchospora tenuis TaxID=198213 RepID=A0AAD6A2B0_9POAL|nr:hypothetical protein LUZ61_012112 [Rhynchospora tenuis]